MPARYAGSVEPRVGRWRAIETTLLEHVGGTVTATRVAID